MPKSVKVDGFIPIPQGQLYVGDDEKYFEKKTKERVADALSEIFAHPEEGGSTAPVKLPTYLKKRIPDWIINIATISMNSNGEIVLSVDWCYKNVEFLRRKYRNANITREDAMRKIHEELAYALRDTFTRPG
jgi:hypothetical protein